MRNIFLHTTKVPLFVRVVSLYVVISAPILLMHTVVYADSTTTEPSVSQPVAPLQKAASAPPKPAVKVGTPKRLLVPSASIDLPVAAGSYDSATNSWTLSDSKSYFATITDRPNDQKGSTLIYGHNIDTVFAPLSTLQSGDTAELRTTSGHTFVYSLTRSDQIRPDDISILERNPRQPELILMTCEGIWSESRRVMFFALEEVR